ERIGQEAPLDHGHALRQRQKLPLADRDVLGQAAAELLLVADHALAAQALTVEPLAAALAAAAADHDVDADPVAGAAALDRRPDLDDRADDLVAADQVLGAALLAPPAVRGADGVGADLEQAVAGTDRGDR